MKIYLAHPLTGLSGNDIGNYYENLRKALSPSLEVYCPMAGKESLYTEDILKADGYDIPLATNHAIYSRDKWMVTQSDIVLCDFTEASVVSIGCCMELAIASCYGKHSVVVMGKDNIHNHAFVKEVTSVIYETLDVAIQYINDLSNSIKAR